MLTPEQADEICDMHEIYYLLEDQEEVELLKENNPSLLEAYIALAKFANWKSLL